MAVRGLIACMFFLYASILLVQVEVFAQSNTTVANATETPNVTTVAPADNVTVEVTTAKVENATEKAPTTQAAATTPAAEVTTKATNGVERTLCAASFALYVLGSSLIAMV